MTEHTYVGTCSQSPASAKLLRRRGILSCGLFANRRANDQDTSDATLPLLAAGIVQQLSKDAKKKSGGGVESYSFHDHSTAGVGGCK